MDSNELKQPGRILYLHRTQGRGAEGAHIRGMVDGFRAFGCTVDIVGPPGIDPYMHIGPDKSKDRVLSKVLGWFASKAPQVCFELVELLYNAIALRCLHKQWKLGGGYSFIYERYALNSFAGVFFSGSKKIPLVLEVNDATVIERSRPLALKSVARWIEYSVLQRADMVVTITDHFKELLVSRHGLASQKIMVLPNAIDPKKYELEEKKRLKRAALGIPKNCTVLGCVGAFVPWHGLEFLVETMARCCDKHDIFFLFIGDGPIRQNVEKKAAKLGIKHRVQFTGFVAANQVPYYLDMIDICVIPGANAHCSPMKLFEYMAAGKPVVLPRYKPLLDVVTGGKEGIFFEPNDATSLRNALQKVLASPSLCREMGDDGRRLVFSSFTWSRNSLAVLERIFNRSL